MTNPNLTLSDYKKIRTPFAFFDETGSVNDKNNRYFGLGMIKLMQPIQESDLYVKNTSFMTK